MDGPGSAHPIAPGQCHHPQGLDLEQESRHRKAGGPPGEMWKREEGTLPQGCIGLLQARGRLKGCPRLSPRCGAAIVLAGRHGCPMAEGKVGKSWG